MNPEKKLSQLYDLKSYIETDTFQENIMKPLYAEMDKLKDAYDCQTLKELHYLKGKKDGLKFLIRLLKLIEEEIKKLEYDVENN